jgi:hypothetical protein
MRIIWLFVFLFPCIIYCQKHDNVWILGGASISDTLDGYQWGTMIADFDREPFAFRYDSLISLDMKNTGDSYADKNGKLVMYTNGQSVHGYDHKPIPRLDTISYSTYWENFNYPNYLPDGSNWISGFPIEKGAMMLPSFTENQHVLFHFKRTNLPNDNINGHRTTSLLMTEVKFDFENPRGKVIYKEKEILNGFFQGGYSACRHANGRDWWIIHNGEYNEAHYVFLYSPNGIELIHKFTDCNPINQRETLIQGNFSKNGKLYVTSETIGSNYDTMYLTIYNFSRETGTLNRKEFKKINPQVILYGCVEFSHSNQYLYISSGVKMFQYDITKTDILSTEKVIEEYDGSTFSYVSGSSGQQLRFSNMQLGPDGRIYCIPPGGVRSMHVIDYPDEQGVDATMIQNKYKLPCQIFNSIPSYPNYRLGPLDGSSCDTLGLDNHPLAKYRYEPDTIEYKRIRFTDLSYFRPETWSWDFGDGSPKIAQKSPYHTYTADGTYRVCLTVSNENSSNTFCRNITIGVSATDDNKPNPIDVNLFPNPVQDVLLVTIGEYIPAHAHIEFYSALGQQVHRQRVYYGHNNVDMTALPSGTYGWRIVDKGVVVKSGEVIKIEN